MLAYTPSFAVAQNTRIGPVFGSALSLTAFLTAVLSSLTSFFVIQLIEMMSTFCSIAHSTACIMSARAQKVSPVTAEKEGNDAYFCRVFRQNIFAALSPSSNVELTMRVHLFSQRRHLGSVGSATIHQGSIRFPVPESAVTNETPFVKLFLTVDRILSAPLSMMATLIWLALESLSFWGSLLFSRVRRKAWHFSNCLTESSR